VQDLGVFVGSILGRFRATAFEGLPMTLVLEALRCDETLDLRCLSVWLRALLLWLDFTSDDELADIVLLAETKESSDLGGTLWTQSLGVYGVGDARNLVIALLDNGKSKDRQVHANYAATDRLPLALTSSSRSVTGVAIGEEETDTGWVHNTLLHWKALFVVATGNLKDIALEFVANAVARNLCTHSPIHKDTELALIVNFDQLL